RHARSAWHLHRERRGDGGPEWPEDRTRLRLVGARAGGGDGGKTRSGGLFRGCRPCGCARPRGDDRPTVRCPFRCRVPPPSRRGVGGQSGSSGRRESKGVSVSTPSTSRRISVEINGMSYERDVPASLLLVHFLRDDLDLTGTHIGCDTGSCGACTVQLGSDAIKSCCMLAVQA